ncbi:MAG: FHA domain-containing protein, partial [Candidatus Sumerlaeota bacterium]
MTEQTFWFEDKEGEMFPIPPDAEFPVSIGRVTEIDLNKKNAVQIPQKEESMTVSRLHAKLWKGEEEETFEIADVGSSHGVFISGEKLENDEKREIKPGDEVQLGLYFLTLQSETESQFEEDEGEVTRIPGVDGTAILDDFVPGADAPVFDDEPLESEKLYL